MVADLVHNYNHHLKGRDWGVRSLQRIVSGCAKRPASVSESGPSEANPKGFEAFCPPLPTDQGFLLQVAMASNLAFCSW